VNTVVKTWESGDYVYGAVNAFNYPAGIAHLFHNGREYPVAQLNADHTVIRWIPRSEPFPFPIKGYNRPW
jgi:hypothetical protein